MANILTINCKTPCEEHYATLPFLNHWSAKEAFEKIMKLAEELHLQEENRKPR